jgi:hypothetical protein
VKGTEKGGKRREGEEKRTEKEGKEGEQKETEGKGRKGDQRDHPSLLIFSQASVITPFSPKFQASETNTSSIATGKPSPFIASSMSPSDFLVPRGHGGTRGPFRN